MIDEPQLQMKAINNCLNVQPVFVSPYRQVVVIPSNRFNFGVKTDLIFCERLPRQLPRFYE